jgi:uncharacterized protein YqeY
MGIKMTLQARIYKAMQDEKDTNKKSILKVIAGELQRQSKKILSNDEVTDILRKLIKYEKERLSNLGYRLSLYLETLYEFMPIQMSEKIIKEFIRDKIDFSKLKNKNQAISILKKEFGSSIDGNLVKAIIDDWQV